MKTQILLYEDNKELRESLSVFISFSEELELLGAFENCAKVRNHLEKYDPDIILMDIDMPIMNGIDGLKIIREVDEQLPVLMLTVFEDNQHILTAIQNGATGYLLKQHLSTDLQPAIANALDGGAPMSPVVAKLVLSHIRVQKQKNEKEYHLTLREKEILQSLTDGNSFKMIAGHLGITTQTVNSHIKNIYEKLGVHSQAEAVSKTFRERLI